MNEDTSPQGTFLQETRSPIIAATAIPKNQLDNAFKNPLYSFLQSEIPYAEVLQELSGGRTHISMNELLFEKMNGLLAMHDRNQDKDLDFWRIVVPDRQEIKKHIV